MAVFRELADLLYDCDRGSGRAVGRHLRHVQFSNLFDKRFDTAAVLQNRDHERAAEQGPLTTKEVAADCRLSVTTLLTVTPLSRGYDRTPDLDLGTNGSSMRA